MSTGTGSRYKVRGRPKVGHKKSRYGCEKCKKRRVKCDEVRPVCSNCSRLRLECHWATSPFGPRIQSPSAGSLAYVAASSLSPTDSESSATASAPGRPPATPAQRFNLAESSDNETLFTQFDDETTRELLPESRERRMLEHRLMQNYVYNMTTPFRNGSSHEWEKLLHDRLPKLTLKYDNVLFSLCANSATHMLLQNGHRDTPEPMLVDAQQSYLVAAVREQRLMVGVLTAQQQQEQQRQRRQQHRQQDQEHHLPRQPSQPPANDGGNDDGGGGSGSGSGSSERDGCTIDVETADAVCLASLLLMMHSFAMLQRRPLEPYSPPLEWLQMGRGAGVLIRSSAAAIFSLDDERARASLLNVVDIYPRFPVDDGVYFEPDMLVGLEGVLAQDLPSDGDDWGDSEIRDAYTKTLGYVGSVLHAIQHGEPVYAICTRIQAFAFLVPGRFLDLLGCQRPRALVVLAHFFAAVAQVSRDVWWLGNGHSNGQEPTARREIRAIQRVLPREWHPLIAGPLEAMGLQ